MTTINRWYVKLITSSPKQNAIPVIPVELKPFDLTGHEVPPSNEIANYEVSFVADKPQPIVWALPLSWKMSNLPRPVIHMNAAVKEWVKYSTAFSNWLYTALSVFVSLTIEEISIPIPDQFIDDLDHKELTISRFKYEIHIMA